jgi:hypothetical protein
LNGARFNSKAAGKRPAGTGKFGQQKKQFLPIPDISESNDMGAFLRMNEVMI